MDGAGERQKPQPYEGFVIDLIRTLVEKEGCTSSMVHELTGIPLNRLGGLYRDHTIQSKHEQTPPWQTGSRRQIAAVRRARKMAILKVRYAETIQKAKESQERRMK